MDVGDEDLLVYGSEQVLNDPERANPEE